MALADPTAGPADGALDLPGRSLYSHSVRRRIREAQCFCRRGQQHCYLLRLFYFVAPGTGAGHGRVSAGLAGCLAPQPGFWDFRNLVNLARALVMSDELAELKIRYARLDLLYKVGNVIHSTLDPQEALQLILSQA